MLSTTAPYMMLCRNLRQIDNSTTKIVKSRQLHLISRPDCTTPSTTTSQLEQHATQVSEESLNKYLKIHNKLKTKAISDKY
jgi:hypothetical protein